MVPALAAPLPIHISANSFGKVTDGPGIWVPAIHVGNWDKVPGSWPRHGHHWLCGYLGSEPEDEDLSHNL